MAGLVDATAVRTSGDRLIATLDPAWDIWGPAGGYIAAIALAAVRTRADDGHRPLTLTGQFVSVAKPGDVDVRVTLVKGGGSALHAVTLAQGERIVFQAQVWTSARADASLPVAPVMPEVPGPERLRGMAELMTARGQKPIAFWDNLEGRPANFRLADDLPPDDPRQYRWMRFRDWTATGDPFVEAMRHLLLIDIGVWPAHWHRQTERSAYSAPSLDVWAQFHDPRPSSEWLLSEADADVSGHGAISGRVRIWSEDGRAVATGGGQCLVIAPRG